jgi:hypothetical protein
MRGCALVGLFDDVAATVKGRDSRIAVGRLVQVVYLCFDSACASLTVVTPALVVGGAGLSNCRSLYEGWLLLG